MRDLREWKAVVHIVVGVRGFEPPTSCSQSKRATGLRYTPTTLDSAIQPALEQTA